MLVRNSDGEIIIILRKDYASEKTYNKKIYNIMSTFVNNKSSIIIPPIKNEATNNNNNNNNNNKIHSNNFDDE